MKFLCLAVVLGCLVGVGFAEEIPADAFYSQTEMVTSYGYPCETHYVLTEDGYNLTAYRIPYGRAGPSSGGGVRPAVVLQHGLLDFSFTWILNMPSQSLAFILADQGFDVWLPNNRGNKESRRPTTTGLTPDDREWWQFSWDQMALYDVPGVINYVLKVSGNAQLSYVGHSEGTTQMFAALVSRPSLASLISSFVGFGPVAFANNLEQTTFRRLAEDHVDTIYELVDGKLFAPTPDWVHKIGADACAVDPTACQSVIEWICGPHKGAFNNSRMPVVAAQEPAGTSAMNMMHWGQMVRSSGEVFQMFDYDWEGNQKHYGQHKPPRYNLAKYPASLPTYLVSGGLDILADPIDVAVLLAFLPANVTHHQVPDYAHLDYVWAVDACTVVYPHVIDFIRRHLPAA